MIYKSTGNSFQAYPYNDGYAWNLCSYNDGYAWNLCSYNNETLYLIYSVP